ncbi:FAD/NAD(P)-binding protein [Streptomyces sp. NPDC020801]|uniref:FAD/NAD(P)-binding protein n=1 Tax=unclassified Streptomyces TaxID=2593676 RepID=UPI00378EFCF0
MPRRPLSICIVGVGPRGLSVLERLCANARRSPHRRRVHIYLVDPWPAGAGAVWRTDQSQQLLMNTVACQITVFTDKSVSMDGPVEPGSSLYEWAQEVRGTNGREAAGRDERTVAEARRLGPDSYPTRAFFGSYLREMFARICLAAPPHVDITTHCTRAVALGGGHDTVVQQSVLLENGRLIDGLDAVVLSQGHVGAELSNQERLLSDQARKQGLLYVPPANPADVDLSGIAPGEQVLLRGLGLNFFDHMALLTSGRGGRFVRHGTDLVYEKSGLEPRLCATSRRGIPYHSRGENEKGAHGRYVPRLLTAQRIAQLHQRAQDGDRVYFGTDLWPLITRETECVYYSTLLDSCGRSSDREAFSELYLAAEREAHRVEILDAFGIPAESRWDWDRLAHPSAGRQFTGRDAFHTWLIEYLRQDVRQARGGNVSNPVKAALDILRDLRNEIRLAVDHGGLDGNSHRNDLEGWYTPLNAFLSIGPPAFRIEQMIALIKAGILEVTGPGAKIHADPGRPGFVCTSRDIPAPPVGARVLIEARLPEPDLRRTTDPLMRQLLDEGHITPFRIEGGCGTSYETGGLAVTARPGHVIDAQGRAHPRRFAHGVPTESVHWVTAAAARPGVDSVSLADADAIARAVLALPPALAAGRTGPGIPAGAATGARADTGGMAGTGAGTAAGAGGREVGS